MSSKTRKHIVFYLSLMLSTTLGVNAQILQEEQSLEGIWRFSIGDDSRWKDFDFNDSQWQKIRVPASWESEGYNDYNGFAWYRKTIHIDVLPNQDLILKIERIDDADEVFINGRFVGRSGGMPPYTKTAHDQERIYSIPKSYWQKGKNVIAIRVYDFYSTGGIKQGPVSLNTDLTKQLISLDLSGTWRFAVHNQRGAEQTTYDDSEWSTIRVPAKWEEAGREGYDGVAWYRKTFRLPEHLKNKELVLLVGKIDDEDKTWLNGKRIGGVSPLNTRSSLARGLFNSHQAHTTLRAYTIPQNLISTQNVIAVKVLDTGYDGGIYEGPVGIMTKEQFNLFKKVARKEPDMFDNIWEWLNN